MQSTQNPVTGLVTPARTLRSAASYLERHGWVQGAYYDMSAEVFTPAACMVGAIAIVCYGGPVDCPAHLFDEPGFDEFEAAFTVVDGYVFDHGQADTAYDFNDAKGRTAAEVVQTLRDAALDWENRQPQEALVLGRLLAQVCADVRLIGIGGAA